MIILASSAPKNQSDLAGSGIFLSTSASTTGKIAAGLQVDGSLGVMAIVGNEVGVADALEVGMAVAVGSNVRVGFPIVERGVSVGMEGPKRLWQADKRRIPIASVIREDTLKITFMI
jgi:hypothetical protein